MSNKRNSAARKQELKKRAARSGSKRLDPHGAASRQAAGGGDGEYREPEVQRQVHSGGGVLMRMRGAVKRQAGGQAGSPARKERPILEWALWAAALGAAVLFVVRYLRARG